MPKDTLMRSNSTSQGLIKFSSVPSHLTEQGQGYPLKQINDEHATPWTNQFLAFYPYAPIKVMPHYPPSGQMRGYLTAIEPNPCPRGWGH